MLTSLAACLPSVLIVGARFLHLIVKQKYEDYSTCHATRIPIQGLTICTKHQFEKKKKAAHSDNISHMV